MVLEVHHVPGRMRVRLRALRRNEPAAAPLRAALLDLRGVRSASVNVWTGSLLIHYDRDGFEPGAIWATLRRFGHVDEEPRRAGADLIDTSGALAAAVGKAIVDAAASAALEHLVGRSAGAVIRLLV